MIFGYFLFKLFSIKNWFEENGSKRKFLNSLKKIFKGFSDSDSDSSEDYEKLFSQKSTFKNLPPIKMCEIVNFNSVIFRNFHEKWF